MAAPKAAPPNVHAASRVSMNATPETSPLLMDSNSCPVAFSTACGAYSAWRPHRPPQPAWRTHSQAVLSRSAEASPDGARMRHPRPQLAIAERIGGRSMAGARAARRRVRMREHAGQRPNLESKMPIVSHGRDSPTSGERSALSADGSSTMRCLPIAATSASVQQSRESVGSHNSIPCPLFLKKCRKVYSPIC